nr:RWD domain-containing protein 2A isoform X2 [Neodiprion pinetum]
MKKINLFTNSDKNQNFERMSVNDKRVENYQAQIAELEALQAIYPDELTVIDHGILADINNFILDIHSDVPHPLEYIVTILHLKGKCQLYVTLPNDYPMTKPEVYVRSELFDRIQQFNFNTSLINFSNAQEEGLPSIYMLISWVQENLEKYLKSSNSKTSQKSPVKLSKKIVLSFSRYWIYSHHIYSKLKRREIIEIAKENNLSGFCLAGKPGIVCIEGALEECEDWWQRVLRLVYMCLCKKYIFQH